MAIATYADFLTTLNNPEMVYFNKTGIARFSGQHPYLAGSFPVAATAPSTAVVCNNTTSSAYNINSAVGGEAGTSWALARASINVAAGNPFVLLYDRLSHQGGLSAIVTSAQTTNLPTAALTRYTSGVGVMICVDIYTAIGATATTLTASYTNQSGTSGRTTKPIVFGGSGFNAASTRLWLPLQDGDTGARSVESVNVLATTGTAGNFGITLIKPLVYIMPPIAGLEVYGTNIHNAAIGGGMQFTPILEGACLETCTGNGTASGMGGSLGFIRL